VKSGRLSNRDDSYERNHTNKLYLESKKMENGDQFIADKMENFVVLKKQCTIGMFIHLIIYYFILVI